MSTLPWESDRGRASARLFLGVLVAVTLAKAVLVSLGPDVEGDAYLHAMRGRRMLLEPGDLGVHWVWLPNLHALYAATTALGLPMQAVRVLAVAASSLTPIVVARGLTTGLARRAPDPRFVELEARLPWIAGALLALEPLSFSMGHSGLTESFFQLAVWSGAFAFARGAYGRAGLAFAIAAGFRYEAWALLPVVFALAWVAPPPRARTSLAWLIPAMAISAWCLALHRATGEWLPFLTPNREFVRRYFEERGYLWGSTPNLPIMIAWYPCIIPIARMLGPLALLVVLGRTWIRDRAPRPLLGIGAGLLGFLTLGFVTGTHLGLVRHATSLAPLFVIAAAAGAGVAGASAHRRWPRVASPAHGRAIARAMHGSVGVLALCGTIPVVGLRLAQLEDTYGSERAAAEALREAFVEGDAIACEDIPTEVLSALPPEVFVRDRLRPSDAAALTIPEGSRHLLVVVSRKAVDDFSTEWERVWTDDRLAVLRLAR